MFTACTGPADAPRTPAARKSSAVTSTDKRVAREEPRAKIESDEHHFGTVEENSHGSHTFIIDNTGNAPLDLSIGEVSCKCTSAKLSRKVVPPGESAEVLLDWKAEAEAHTFHQWTRINTNDPTQREIALHIHGAIRNDLHVEPIEVNFGELPPLDTKQEVQVVVTSDRTADFLLEDIKLTDERFQVTAEKLSEQQSGERKVAGGYLLRITSPDEMPSGSFSPALQFVVKQGDAGKSQSFTLPVQGRVLGRISVMGAKIDEFGSVNLGTLAYGRGGTARLKVKLRDSNPDLVIKSLQVTPDFVKVELKPTAGASVPGLYDLVVQVPEDTEPCSYRVGNEAKVHFEFDHPRVAKLDLKVDFSVRPAPELP